MNIKGEFYLILANLIFSTLGIFTRELNKELMPITQVSYRLIIATLFYLIFFSIKDKKFLKVSSKNLFKLFVAGFFGYGLMVVFVVLAFLNTNYGNASTFLQLSPIFTLLISWKLLKEKIKLSAILAIITSVIGILIVFRPDFSNLDIGIVYALISAVIYAPYIVIIRSMRNIDIRTRLFYTTFFAGFFLLPFVLIFETPVNISFSFMTGFYIVLMAILNIIGYTLMNLGLKNVLANIAGILGVSQAFFGIIISYVVYNEMFSFYELIGAFFILSSIIIINLNFKKFDQSLKGEN